MAEFVASSSRSMQMLDDLSDTLREIRVCLELLLKEWELLLKECNMLNANDSESMSKINTILKFLNANENRIRKMLNANDSDKGMSRYVACHVEDILEFSNAEVGIWLSRKKKEKKTCIGSCVGRQDDEDDDGIGMTKVMQMLEHETTWIYYLFLDWFPVPDGGESADRVVELERLSGRSVVLPKVKHFVGMEKDLKQLVSCLTDPQQQRVVWVWGVEGVGKTTLAAKIFMDPQVKSHFNAFAWVSLTQGKLCQIDSLLQDILEQLGERSEKKITRVKIKQKFDDTQRRKKCLIVIDGIWKPSQWAQIRSALLTTDMTSVMETGWHLSRILVTTRNETIACGDDRRHGVSVVHKLSSLDENDGWELLQKHAFSGNACPGERIIPKGYDRLRFHLKQCFLYLGIFKQDIDAEDLTFLWAAEGMLFAQQQDKDNETIIDTAERYLQELNSKGMLKVKVDGLSANKMVMPLSLHNDHSVDDIERILLTQVFHFNKQVTSSSTAAKPIRSLFFLNSDQEYVDLPVSMSKYEKLKLLRTVHFVRCKFKDRKLPEEIETLVRLRYLGIIYCDLDELPSSISNSRELHVLNVRAYDDVKMTVPNIFSKPSQLSQMKHLRLPSNILENEQSDKLKLDGLHDLETLVGFNVHVHDTDSLSNLKKLRLLVTHVGDNASLKAIIELLGDPRHCSVQIRVVVEYECNFTSSEDGMTDLEEMLMCQQLYALTFSMVHIHNFPNIGAYASSGLTQIKLIGCELSEDPMKALGMFRSLRRLCLGHGAFVGSKIEIHQDGGFKKLEYLEFRCLPNLEELLVDSRAMPSLSTFTVKRCPKLKELLVDSGIIFL